MVWSVDLYLLSNGCWICRRSLLRALIARCRTLDLRCSSRLKLPTMTTKTGQTGESTILKLTIKNLKKHNELYPPERRSITEMIVSQFDWLLRPRYIIPNTLGITGILPGSSLFVILLLHQSISTKSLECL